MDVTVLHPLIVPLSRIWITLPLLRKLFQKNLEKQKREKVTDERMLLLGWWAPLYKYQDFDH